MEHPDENNVDSTDAIKVNANFFLKEQIDAFINAPYHKEIIRFDKRVQDGISMGLGDEINIGGAEIYAHIASLRECESDIIGIIQAIECRTNLLPGAVVLNVPGMKKTLNQVRERIARFESMMMDDSEDAD